MNDSLLAMALAAGLGALCGLAVVLAQAAFGVL